MPSLAPISTMGSLNADFLSNDEKREDTTLKLLFLTAANSCQQKLHIIGNQEANVNFTFPIEQ